MNKDAIRFCIEFAITLKRLMNNFCKFPPVYKIGYLKWQHDPVCNTVGLKLYILIFYEY